MVQHGRTLAVAAIGAIVLALGLMQDRTELALPMVTAGLAVVVLSPFLDRVRRLKFGPAEIELHDAHKTVDIAANVDTRASLPDALVDESEEQVAATRYTLANAVFEMVLSPETGPLADCSFQLYLLDADRQVLLPILKPGHAGLSPGFAPGQGVTGQAWETGEYQVAYGDAVCDDTFHLSEEQKQRYADLAAVAALPVTDAAARTIAVLSCSTRDPEVQLDSDDGFAEHVHLGEVVARVLIDVLKWFSDELA